MDIYEFISCALSDVAHTKLQDRTTLPLYDFLVSSFQDTTRVCKTQAGFRGGISLHQCQSSLLIKNGTSRGRQYTNELFESLGVHKMSGTV